MSLHKCFTVLKEKTTKLLLIGWHTFFYSLLPQMSTKRIKFKLPDQKERKKERKKGRDRKREGWGENGREGKRIGKEGKGRGERGKKEDRKVGWGGRKEQCERKEKQWQRGSRVWLQKGWRWVRKPSEERDCCTSCRNEARGILDAMEGRGVTRATCWQGTPICSSVLHAAPIALATVIQYSLLY